MEQGLQDLLSLREMTQVQAGLRALLSPEKAAKKPLIARPKMPQKHPACFLLHFLLLVSWSKMEQD
jgi:hypothetical protein